MPLFPPQAFRNTANTHRRGSRAQQPLASDVLPGTLYFVIEEGLVERSDGATWTLWGPNRTSNLVNYSYSVNQASPPGTNQVRFNAGFPYTTVTQVYFDNITSDGQDVHIGLLRVPTGSLIYVQDKNDNSQFATFQTTAFPTDNVSWVQFPVVHYSHGTAIGGGQLVLCQTTNGPTALTALGLNIPISQTLPGGNNNDFNDPNLGQTQVLRLTGNAGPPSRLTGIIPDVLGLLMGRLLIIANVGANGIFIDAEDAGSLPFSRFSFSQILSSGDSIMCWYDSVSNRWRKLNG